MTRRARPELRTTAQRERHQVLAQVRRGSKWESRCVAVLAGSGALGIEWRRALRDHRLLAVGREDRVGVESPPPTGEGPQDRRDLLLHLLVEDHLPPREAPDDLRGEIVGGRAKPSGGDDQIHPFRGHEAQGRLEVFGTVADDQDV